MQMYVDDRDFDVVSSNSAQQVAVRLQFLLAHKHVIKAGNGQLEGGAAEA